MNRRRALRHFAPSVRTPKGRAYRRTASVEGGVLRKKGFQRVIGAPCEGPGALAGARNNGGQPPNEQLHFEETRG
ncbi:hypothetical protein [Paenibacillus sp. GbtcB18]|uniref:hypothetical protein n=1 Tax=Paenibacillus sp. GbtcB18 TaxID=2824763 RepID=UPI001C30ADFF|nr:hypothetical protein [Paenibacillus sp. GbtcB18]